MLQMIKNSTNGSVHTAFKASSLKMCVHASDNAKNIDQSLGKQALNHIPEKKSKHRSRGGGQGVRTPLKSHKNIGLLSNTGRITCSHILSSTCLG